MTVTARITGKVLVGLRPAMAGLLIAGVLAGLVGCIPSGPPTPPIVTPVETTPEPTPSPTPKVEPASVQEILQAVMDNQTLTSAEKDFITSSFLPVFEQNAQYLEGSGLASRLQGLRIEYDRNPGGCKWASQSRGCIYGQYDDGDNTVTMYNGNNFAESTHAKAEGPGTSGAGTFLHEMLHVMGELPPWVANAYSSPLEGANDLLTREYFGRHSGNTSYDKDVIMACILAELFGADPIREAFFQRSASSLRQYLQDAAQVSSGSAASTVRNIFDHLVVLGETRNSAQLDADVAGVPVLAQRYDSPVVKVYRSMLTGKDLTGWLNPGESFVKVDIAYFNPDNPDKLSFGSHAVATIKAKDGSTRTIMPDYVPQREG